MRQLGELWLQYRDMMTDHMRCKPAVCMMDIFKVIVFTTITLDCCKSCKTLFHWACHRAQDVAPRWSSAPFCRIAGEGWSPKFQAQHKVLKPEGLFIGGETHTTWRMAPCMTTSSPLQNIPPHHLQDQAVKSMLKCPSTVAGGTHQVRWVVEFSTLNRGKHVRIEKLTKSGLGYFNNKKFSSNILLAIVVADYWLLFLDVEDEGRRPTLAGSRHGIQGIDSANVQ